ncbi:MAG TPA: hypothetical protein VMP11_11850 [Verrucomicrobiae bacterium]|nr:hypothetical protein [Verrucomicrobiae bacterium]
MKRAKRLLWVGLVIGGYLSTGHGCSGAIASGDSSAPWPATGVPPDQGTNGSTAVNNQRADDDAIEQMKRDLDAARRHQHLLPNFVTGPGIPKPIGVNFYEMHDYYPSYLLCIYDVKENHYDQSNEPAWFKAALLQIRGSGFQSFSLFKWVAVIIKNDAEHTGESTFEQSFKVGATFSARDVFDPTCDLAPLIARAAMDRHPFMYDPKPPPLGEQQRWLIIERHMAAIGAATNLNENVTGSELHR